MNQAIRKVAVAGAGTMGAGIAQLCGVAGLDTILYDLSRPALDKAVEHIRQGLNKLVELGKIDSEGANRALSSIHTTTDPDRLKADLIIEAIIEDEKIKIDFFNQVYELNGPETIYATNTSSIPVTRLAAGMPDPTRMVGIHFFNPAPIMKLVEIIKGEETSEDVAATSMAFARLLGKTPVVAKDSPGFIVNRVARLYYVEALNCLEENVAGVPEIDSIMENLGFKMGPFRLMDLIGVDSNQRVTESQFALFYYEPRFRPSRIQKQKVDAGHWGRKVKKGFYDYKQ